MKLLALLLTLVAEPSLAAATTLEVQGTASFDSVGSPGLVKIHGEPAPLSGSLTLDGNKVTGSVEAKLDGLKTGIGLRDKHLKETYLEVGKYPTAKWVLEPTELDVGKVAVAGILTIKSETKPAKADCEVTALVGATGFLADCQLKVALKDYPSIGVPSYLGVTVAEDVTLTVKMKLTKG